MSHHPFSSLTAMVFVSIAVFTACHNSPGPGAKIDSKLKGYVLSNPKVLMGIDLDSIKRTDLYQRHGAQLTFPQLNSLPSQIGMDPRRDLSSFLLSWDGADTLALIRGSFRPKEIEDRLRAGSVRTETYNKTNLYGDGKHYVALLPKGIALAGEAGVLKGALAREATGGAEIPEDIHLRMALVSGGAQVWLVSSGIVPLSQISMRSDAATALSNIADYINGTAFGLTLASGAIFDANISCISEEGSTRVHDALRGVIGLARLSTQENHVDQLQIWDSIRVIKDGKTVRIHSELPAGLADKLIDTLPTLTRRF